MEFSANQAFSDGFQHSELSVVACDTQVIPIIYKPKHYSALGSSYFVITSGIH